MEAESGRAPGDNGVPLEVLAGQAAARPLQGAAPPSRASVGPPPAPGGPQWIDSPVTAPSQAQGQDILYQWVDNPTPGHLQAQRQQYLQAARLAPPYYPGLDASTYGMHGRPLETPLHGLEDPSLLRPHHLAGQGMMPPGAEAPGLAHLQQGFGIDAAAAQYAAMAQGLGMDHVGRYPRAQTPDLGAYQQSSLLPPHFGGLLADPRFGATGPCAYGRPDPVGSHLPFSGADTGVAALFAQQRAQEQLMAQQAAASGVAALFAQQRAQEQLMVQEAAADNGVAALFAQQRAQEQLMFQQQAALGNGVCAETPASKQHRPGVPGPGHMPAAQRRAVTQPKGAKAQTAAEDGRGRNRQTPATGRHGTDSVNGTSGAGNGRPRSGKAADTPPADVPGAAKSVKTENLRPMLTSALESLYEDRIKPMANYVKGRLKEKSFPENVIRNFVELYQEHPDLFVVHQSSQAEEASIFLASEPPWFKGWVDIDSPEDNYDEAVWEAFATFLDGEHTFAGGRYGMAHELMQRGLPFFEGLSLGEVCHIVQLAIQHRKLVVYHRKMLKPIQVVLAQPSPPAAVPGEVAEAEGSDISDMDDLCTVLFQMLKHYPQGLRLCRLKQMIKHDFSRKLSEMSFQCTKLIELFGTEPLSGTFVLDTENDGKSIYVRLGNPESFSSHVKQLYAMANSQENRAPRPS